MKKLLLIMLAMFAFGLQNVIAQDTPLKIVTNHPDFNVKIKRCAVNGKTLIIDMIFTNKGTKDVMIGVTAGMNGGYSEIYDDEGNNYKGQNGRIKVKIANSGGYQGEVNNYRLIPEIPVKVSFCVNDFADTAESIAYFGGVVNCKEWGIPDVDKYLIIRNIPITR